MKTFKRVLQIVLYVLIILVFLVAVVFVIAAMNQSKTGISGAFGYTFDVVESPSMAGTIEVGDIVIGKAVDVDKTVINEGDIVTYKTQIQGIATTITHRVSRVVTDNGSLIEYETWGDNREACPVPDKSYRTIYDIVSVYSFRIPKVGLFLNFIKTIWGFLLCIVLPLLAFIVWEVFDLVKIYNRVKKDTLIADALNEASDDVKDAIIREYLAKLEAEEAAKGKNTNK